MQGRVAGLASALVAAAAAGRSRVLDTRLLAPLRSLTADAAVAEQQQQQQEHHEHEQRRRVDANPDDDSSSSRARRLREMEASTSSARSSRFKESFPTAAEVSARLRGSFNGKKGSFKSTAAAAVVNDDSNEDESESDVENSKPENPLRDWRDALEAARELKSSGDPLMDTFGRRHTYLRISLTERCNLRCTYCMPAEGVDDLTPRPDLLSTSEVVRLTRLFAALGVKKVRLTGGEPTLRRDLLEVAKHISSTPGIDTLGLTTNGVSLGIGSDYSVVEARVAALASSGITSLNVSLDTLRPRRFEKLARRSSAGHAAALATIDAAVRANSFRDQVKVNVVVMKGVNDDEVGDFTSWAAESKGKINVRFIEFMPFEANEWETRKVVSYKEMLSRATEALLTREEGGGGGSDENVRLVPFFDGDKDVDGKNGGRRRWHYDGVAKDFALSTCPSSPAVSFITSMTSPFCSSCTRLRLLADGNLKVCLLGGAEVSLRDAMRGGCSDSDLSLLVRGALANKKAAHAGMAALGKDGGGGAVGAGRAMVRIGG